MRTNPLLARQQMNCVKMYEFHFFVPHDTDYKHNKELTTGSLPNIFRAMTVWGQCTNTIVFNSEIKLYFTEAKEKWAKKDDFEWRKLCTQQQWDHASSKYPLLSDRPL